MTYEIEYRTSYRGSSTDFVDCKHTTDTRPKLRAGKVVDDRYQWEVEESEVTRIRQAGGEWQTVEEFFAEDVLSGKVVF